MSYLPRNRGGQSFLFRERPPWIGTVIVVSLAVVLVVGMIKLGGSAKKATKACEQACETQNRWCAEDSRNTVPACDADRRLCRMACHPAAYPGYGVGY